MVKNNIIGMVIFAAFLGRAIWWMKEDAKDQETFLHNLIDGSHKAMMNMTDLILDYMPWAVVALLANTIAQKGLASILDVGTFILALYCRDAGLCRGVPGHADRLCVPSDRYAP